MEMLTALASAGEVAEDMAAITELFCPWKDTMMCIMGADVCTADEGTKSMMEGLMTIPCFCSCPHLANMEDADVNAPTTADCELVTCIETSASCATILPMMEADEDAMTTKKNCDAATTEAPPATSFAATHAAPAVVMGLTAIALVA